MWRHAQPPAVPIHLLSWCICPLQEEAAQSGTIFLWRAADVSSVLWGSASLPVSLTALRKVPRADRGFWRCPPPSFVPLPPQQDREGSVTEKHLRFLTSLRVTLARSRSSAFLFFFFNRVGNHYQFKYSFIMMFKYVFCSLPHPGVP